MNAKIMGATKNSNVVPLELFYTKAPVIYIYFTKQHLDLDNLYWITLMYALGEFLTR